MSARIDTPEARSAGIPPSAPPVQPTGLRRAVFVVMIASVAAIDGAIGLSVIRQRDQILAEAERQSDNLSRVLVEHAAKAMSVVDQALLGASDVISADMLLDPPGGERIAALLRRYLGALPHVAELLVSDLDGNIRDAAVSGVAFDPLRKDRAICGSLAAGHARVIHPEFATSSTMRAQSVDMKDGCPARVIFSHRIEDAGVLLPETVAAVIRPSYFQTFYETLATGSQGATGLWDTSGLLIAGTGPLAARIGTRFQPHPALIDGGPAVRDGVQRIVSRVDRRELIMAYRAVPGLPLFVSTGVGVDEVLAPWREQAMTAAAGGLAITLAIVLMSLMLARMAGQSERAGTALRESERRFRDFAAAASDWYWEQDENLRFTYMSPQNERHSGMRAGDHIGKTRRETNPLGPTEEEWREHEAALQARRPFRNFRFHRVLPDGTVRHVSVNGVPVFDDRGRFRGYRGTGHDISDQIQAQEALQAVIEAVPAIVNVKDAKSRYVLMNAYQARLYGTTPAGAVGKTAEELLGKEYGSYTHGKDRQVFETGKPLDFYEERYAGADGVERDWLSTKVPLFDRSGRVTRILTVAMDITAQKVVERRLVDAHTELQNAKEAAEDANRAKSNFLANMSHELRTPLNAILGFSEMMAQEMLGPRGSSKYREFADGIHRSGTMLLHHINDVLDMAKIEAGRRELHPEWFSFAEAANDAMLVIRQRAQNAGVTLKGDYRHGMPPVHADRRAVGQVLVNLLTNAVKFTPRGGAVTLAADWNDRVFTLAVSDTGVGIEPEMLERLGTPFFQVQPSLTRNHEGTGLGLALSKSLVAMHGGELKIASAPGKGTTVTVTLPRAQVQRDVA
jgi:PAS domain S-box-containing protein